MISRETLKEALKASSTARKLGATPEQQKQVFKETLSTGKSETLKSIVISSSQTKPTTTTTTTTKPTTPQQSEIEKISKIPLQDTSGLYSIEKEVEKVYTKYTEPKTTELLATPSITQATQQTTATPTAIQNISVKSTTPTTTTFSEPISGEKLIEKMEKLSTSYESKKEPSLPQIVGYSYEGKEIIETPYKHEFGYQPVSEYEAEKIAESIIAPLKEQQQSMKQQIQQTLKQTLTNLSSLQNIASQIKNIKEGTYEKIILTEGEKTLEFKTKEEALAYLASIGRQQLDVLRSIPKAMVAEKQIERQTAKAEKMAQDIITYAKAGYKIEKTKKGFLISQPKSSEVLQYVWGERAGERMFSVSMMEVGLPSFFSFIGYKLTRQTSFVEAEKERLSQKALELTRKPNESLEQYTTRFWSTPHIVQDVYIPIATFGISTAVGYGLKTASMTTRELSILSKMGYASKVWQPVHIATKVIPVAVGSYLLGTTAYDIIISKPEERPYKLGQTVRLTAIGIAGAKLGGEIAYARVKPHIIQIGDVLSYEYPEKGLSIWTEEALIRQKGEVSYVRIFGETQRVPYATTIKVPGTDIYMKVPERGAITTGTGTKIPISYSGMLEYSKAIPFKFVGIGKEFSIASLSKDYISAFGLTVALSEKDISTSYGISLTKHLGKPLGEKTLLLKVGEELRPYPSPDVYYSYQVGKYISPTIKTETFQNVLRTVAFPFSEEESTISYFGRETGISTGTSSKIGGTLLKIGTVESIAKTQALTGVMQLESSKIFVYPTEGVAMAGISSKAITVYSKPQMAQINLKTIVTPKMTAVPTLTTKSISITEEIQSMAIRRQFITELKRTNISKEIKPETIDLTKTEPESILAVKPELSVIEKLEPEVIHKLEPKTINLLKEATKLIGIQEIKYKLSSAQRVENKLLTLQKTKLATKLNLSFLSPYIFTRSSLPTFPLISQPIILPIPSSLSSLPKTIAKEKTLVSKKVKGGKKTILADILSVQRSQALFGKATHPEISEKVFKEAKKTLYMHIPTKELKLVKERKII